VRRMKRHESLAAGPVTKPTGALLTVYYDGTFPVRVRKIAAYRLQAGAEHCAWIDASWCPESALGFDLSRDMARARIHVRRIDGVLLSRMRGTLALWRILARTASAERAASIGPLMVLRDAVDRAFWWRRPVRRRAHTVSGAQYRR